MGRPAGAGKRLLLWPLKNEELKVNLVPERRGDFTYVSVAHIFHGVRGDGDPARQRGAGSAPWISAECSFVFAWVFMPWSSR